MKGLFSCKQDHPYIGPTIAALCTCMKNFNKNDWKKLDRLLQYINGTRNEKLILSADDFHVIKWYVDADFDVHTEFYIHTSGGMT